MTFTANAAAAKPDLAAVKSAAPQQQMSPPEEAREMGALRRGFAEPPNAARPRVWWHWINGNVHAEGAKLDLEWMKRVGIGGVHVFSGGLPGPVVVPQRQPFMSEGWKAALRSSIAIANSAGMEVGIAGSPGWSLTGGPWVRAVDGMKKYVWSETRVEGGKPFNGVLAEPPRDTGPFQGLKRGRKSPQHYDDSYVVAFRTPASEFRAKPLALIASDPTADLSLISKAPLTSKVALALDGGGTAWIEARYAGPTVVAAVTLGLPSGAEVEVRASDDGTTFRSIARTHIESPKALTHPLVQQTIAIPATRARVFRVVLKPIAQPAPLPVGPEPARPGPPLSSRVDVSMVAFETGGRVNRFEAKAGFQPTVGIDDVHTPANAPAIPRNSVIDLTRKFRAGRLDWSPPRGDWTVLRFGWSLTGQTNGPAEPEATGLEVDKLDPEAVGRYIEAYLRLYEQAAGNALGPNGIQTLLTDSWEAGVQNWTPLLMAEFRKRRGYDPLPLLPVLSGRVVGSADVSDRFLADFRQTLKDLVADNHHRVLASALHAKGMHYYTEAQGDTSRAIADGMTLKARSDIPTAEFWYRPFAAGPGQLSLKADLEEAASAAHVYGKPLAAAEALTVAAGTDPWSFSPRMLKPVADEIFARGINRFLIHDSHHQPLADQKPGLMMLMFGQFFNRNDTWAEDAKPWVDYLARTSFLLQQGRFVADVAYFYGEDKTLTELFSQRVNTDVPSGYRYDYINPEALLTLLSVKDGALVTPSGMQYGVLFLPKHVDRLSLAAMRKLETLAKDGAVIVGRKPTGSLGLASSDSEVRRIADRMWGSDVASGGRRFGKGRIYSDLNDAFAGERITPDVSFANSVPDSTVLTLHRRTEAADIYFLSNQSDAAHAFEGIFRVSGKAPELWRAETGASEPLSYQQVASGVKIPLRLQPHEAVFVVFAKSTQRREWIAPKVSRTLIQTLAGPWMMRFEPGRGAPASTTLSSLKSWSEVDEAGVRYFSGSGTYEKTFHVPAAALHPRGRYVLDLGDVRELASVSLNGRSLGTVWHAPYEVDLTPALKPGANRLEVRVVNLWPNRLIGDKQPGAKAIAFAPQSPYKADSPLLASGLLGPVRLLAEDWITDP